MYTVDVNAEHEGDARAFRFRRKRSLFQDEVIKCVVEDAKHVKQINESEEPRLRFPSARSLRSSNTCLL